MFAVLREACQVRRSSLAFIEYRVVLFLFANS